jgi:phosphoglycolate phosphatase-like HAD superfamily hydrolase
MTTLFWDIDGTLLTTARAGVPAWEQAVEELTGKPFQLSSIRVPGLTDYQIAVRTFELLDEDAGPDRIERLVRRYEELLPTTLPSRQGAVLPNVREILEACARRDDVRSYLLTGNTAAGARAKLGHYDLLRYFEHGAFAEDTGARATIASRGLDLARQKARVDVTRVFVIGDTPHDVHCADAIGARTIAVATGGYSETELAEHRPWRVLAQLPAPDEFFQLLFQSGTSPAGREPASARQ